MTRPTRLYLSGPIRGLDPEVSRTNFQQAYDQFKSFGYDCYMPGQPAIADLNHNPSYFLTDMAIIISWADAVMLVSTFWEKSTGCQAEIWTAKAIDIPVWVYVSYNKVKKIMVGNPGDLITTTGHLTIDKNSDFIDQRS